MVKKLKEKEMQRTTDKQNKTPEEAPTPIQEPEPVQAKEPAPKPQPKPETKPQPKAQVAAPTPKPTKTEPTKTTQTTQNIATSGTYIQVASVSRKTPDAGYLATLTNKGYDYKLYHTKVNDKDITKILVGPYESNTAAQNALANVRRDLASGAFIFRVP
jgi:DedD protein